jgi:S1-C subfamily serine protease
MVSLGVENGRVVIQGFSHGSASEKAGLKKGDVILSLDGTPVNNVEDVRIELLFKKKGDTVKVKALRKDLIEDNKKMEFGVTLQ